MITMTVIIAPQPIHRESHTRKLWTLTFPVGDTMYVAKDYTNLINAATDKYDYKALSVMMWDIAETTTEDKVWISPEDFIITLIDKATEFDVKRVVVL